LPGRGIAFATARLGKAVVARVAGFGEATAFLFVTLLRIAFLRFKPARVIDGIFVYGSRSMGIVAVAALFVGMGIAIQVEIELRRFGASQNIANVVAVSIVRELGPILTALLLAGRAGSGITAEIGAMRIGEQLSAMKMLGLDVHRHFTAPMVLATTISTFCLTVVFDIVGVAGGYAIAILELSIPFHTYHELTKEILRSSDVIAGLAKSAFFGLVIGWVGCWFGLTTEGGGKGLGRATTSSVVASSLAILVSNYFLTRALIRLLEG
jgi:phospholipid/cholesterol/gamma-HCH transport system permease protein